MAKTGLRTRLKKVGIRVQAWKSPSSANILKRTSPSIARIQEANERFPDTVERIAGATLEGLIPAKGFAVVKLQRKTNRQKMIVLRQEEQAILAKAIRRAFIALAIPKDKQKACSEYMRQIFSWSSHSGNIPADRAMAHRQMERIGQQLEKLIGKRKTNWFIRAVIRNHATYMGNIADATKQELRISNT